MKKSLMVLIVLLIINTGCNDSYDVDDYRIIEIAYGEAIDENLARQFDDFTPEIIENSGDLYVHDRMCDSRVSRSGYRKLDNSNGRYLVV